MKEKKDYKFRYVGRIVVQSGKTKEGKEYSSEKLQLGMRYDKNNNPVKPIELNDKEKAALLDKILEKDLYLFEPSKDAPEFIKRYVAVKKEDLEDVEI